MMAVNMYFGRRYWYMCSKFATSILTTTTHQVKCYVSKMRIMFIIFLREFPTDRYGNIKLIMIRGFAQGLVVHIITTIVTRSSYAFGAIELFVFTTSTSE